jgi:hypothetical protein
MDKVLKENSDTDLLVKFSKDMHSFSLYPLKLLIFDDHG